MIKDYETILDSLCPEARLLRFPAPLLSTSLKVRTEEPREIYDRLEALKDNYGPQMEWAFIKAALVCLEPYFWCFDRPGHVEVGAKLREAVRAALQLESSVVEGGEIPSSLVSTSFYSSEGIYQELRDSQSSIYRAWGLFGGNDWANHLCIAMYGAVMTASTFISRGGRYRSWLTHFIYELDERFPEWRLWDQYCEYLANAVPLAFRPFLVEEPPIGRSVTDDNWARAVQPIWQFYTVHENDVVVMEAILLCVEKLREALPAKNLRPFFSRIEAWAKNSAKKRIPTKAVYELNGKGRYLSRFGECWKALLKERVQARQAREDFAWNRCAPMFLRLAAAAEVKNVSKAPAQCLMNRYPHSRHPSTYAKASDLFIKIRQEWWDRCKRVS